MNRLRPYLIAAVLVAFATLLTRKTQPVLGEISSFFFVAVMLSTWFGGMGPGLLATGLAGWASAYYFLDIPKGTGTFGWDDALRLATFLSISLIVSSLVNLRRRAEFQLRGTNENLELRVRDRTIDLEKSNRIARDSEEGVRALIDGVSDCAIFELSRDGAVVRWNSRAQSVLGYPESEVLGQRFAIFFSPQEQVRKTPQTHLAVAGSTGRNESEGWRVRRDRSTFWAQVIITALYDEQQNLRGFVHVARDITTVKRLESEVLEISEREQQRIGQDLHDGLGQELTGLAFLTQNLRTKLAGRSVAEAAELARISDLINSTIETTRNVAKGLSPVELGADGLAGALRNLAARVRDSYRIPCSFTADRSVEVSSHNAAVNLYRIAQEAVGNAVRHSGCTKISILLEQAGDEITLEITDDGIGITDNGREPVGLGLHLMPYRARMIGGSFECRPRHGGGTLVRCTYTVSDSKIPERGVVSIDENDVLKGRP